MSSNTQALSGETDVSSTPPLPSQLPWTDAVAPSASSAGSLMVNESKNQTIATAVGALDMENKIDPVQRAIYENLFTRRSAKKVVAFRTCEICNIDLTGQAVIDAHYAGSKHAKKLKAQELLSNLVGTSHVAIPSLSQTSPFQCSVCQGTYNSSQQLDVHYSVSHPGTEHKPNIPKAGDQSCSDKTESSDLVTISPNSTCNSSSTCQPEIQRPDLYCTLCSISVNSPQQLEQHLGSKKHVERETGRRQPRPGPYYKPAGRGNRGGLGSRGHTSSKASHFTSLSNSFKSGGYTNSFIKEEGGVIMPKNSSSNSQSSSCERNADQTEQKLDAKPGFKPNSKFTAQSRKGNFGSLTPYIKNDDASTQNRGWDYAHWASGYGYYDHRSAGVVGGGYEMNNVSVHSAYANANNFEAGYSNEFGAPY